MNGKAAEVKNVTADKTGTENDQRLSLASKQKIHTP
jgi:hypothetical protein